MQSLTVFCTRCGREIPRVDAVTNDAGDYFYCARCEADHAVAQAAEFPDGQCSFCGAAGFEVTLSDGTVQTHFHHAEGGCPRWYDVADALAAIDEEIRARVASVPPLGDNTEIPF